MKIAISSTGTTMESNVDPRFGRASYFVIVDPENSQIVDVIDNRASQEAAHGAGINAATIVAQSGAEVVLTGRVGPKAFAILQAAGIKVVSEVSGTIQEALEAFRSGSAEFSHGPDCHAHTSSPSPRTGWQAESGQGKNRGCGCQGKGKGRGR